MHRNRYAIESFIKLDGGVFMSPVAYTFTRSLGTSGSTFQWMANGGGFAVDSNPMDVNIGNCVPHLGVQRRFQIVGTLKLNSCDSWNASLSKTIST